MKKLLVISIFLLSSVLIVDVYAQESSPFADLADDTYKYRTVRTASGSTVITYMQKLDEYLLLSAKYEESYGSAKVEMGERTLARGKDVLIAKLGAIDSHIVAQRDKLSGAELLTEEGKNAINGNISTYSDFVKEYEPQVNDAESIASLVTLNRSINAEAISLMDSMLVFKAGLSLLQGRTLIEQMMSQTDLFQAHISAAVDAGVDTTQIQSNFDEAMLSLEEAKTTYNEIEDELDILSASTFKYSNVRSKLVNVNRSIASAHSLLQTVIVDLETIYGPSPWNVTKYL